MNLLTAPHRQHETDMGPAIRRLKRFATAGLAAILVLFFGLAIKAQVVQEKDHVWNIWPGYERLR
jgi:hypothetical protein